MPVIYQNPKTGQLSHSIPDDAFDRIAILEKAGWVIVSGTEAAAEPAVEPEPEVEAEPAVEPAVASKQSTSKNRRARK